MGAIYIQIAVALGLVAIIVFFAIDDWKARKLREKEDQLEELERQRQAKEETKE